MRIFISHAQKDEKLAVRLQNMLKKEQRINHVFIFEKNRKYGIQIDQKIIKEILRSDHVVALITKDAKESASVNQELGYAQAKSIPVIPLIEKHSKKGFLVFGAEYITFTESNFDKACKKILNYIIEQGPRVKDEETFTPQELLVQKSAHFRHWMQYENHHLIDGLIVRFQLKEELYRNSIFNEDPVKNLEGLHDLKSYLRNNPEEIKEHILKSNMYSYRKFSNEFSHYANSFETLDVYPHSELFPKENDMLIKIKDMIRSDDEHQFDFGYLARYLLEEEFPKNANTFQGILGKVQVKWQKEQLERNFNFKVRDLIEFSILVITLQEEFEKIREKYGELGIKSTDPDYNYADI